MKIRLKAIPLMFSLVIICFLSCKSQSEIDLISFRSDNCEKDTYRDVYKLQNRIVNIETAKSSRTYHLFSVDNCNPDKEGLIEVREDTLNFLFGNRGSIKKPKPSETEITLVAVDECDCAFNAYYKIKGLKNPEKLVTLLNGNPIAQTDHKYHIMQESPTFSLVNGDTINFIDIYGLKQGLHIITLKDGRIYRKAQFIDDEMISGLADVRFDFFGYDVAKTYIENGKYTVRKFYNDGKLIKTCETLGDFEEGFNCKYEQ